METYDDEVKVGLTETVTSLGEYHLGATEGAYAQKNPQIL